MEKIRNTYCRIYTFVYIPLRLLLKINSMKNNKKYKAKVYATFLSYLGMLITIIYLIIKTHFLTN